MFAQIQLFTQIAGWKFASLKPASCVRYSFHPGFCIGPSSSSTVLLDGNISRNVPLSAASVLIPDYHIRRSSGFWTTMQHDAGFRGSARRLGEIESDFVIAASVPRDRAVRKSTSRSPLIRERAFGLGCRRAIREKGDTRSIQTYKHRRSYRTCGLLRVWKDVGSRWNNSGYKEVYENKYKPFDFFAKLKLWTFVSFIDLNIQKLNENFEIK